MGNLTSATGEFCMDHKLRFRDPENENEIIKPQKYFFANFFLYLRTKFTKKSLQIISCETTESNFGCLKIKNKQICESRGGNTKNFKFQSLD
jgi:hypothetical protein